jgi:Uma2 family endonuclease
MTAEPAGHAAWAPDPVRQRHRTYTLEDALKLPDDAPRVEILDGVLSLVPSPTGGHQKIGGLLWMWLLRNAPAEFETLLAVGVAVSFSSTLEPDVVLLRRPVYLEHHYYQAKQAVIAVEIVSSSTRRRDRLEKPGEYAAAAVPHYWRVEQDPLHVFAYDLIDGRYELVADSDTELVLSAPFEIKLPIRDITP